MFFLSGRTGICYAQAENNSTSPAPNSTVQQSQDAPAPILLVGEIKHSERLDRVDDKLAPGKRFRESSLPQWGEPPGRWYRIPLWMAGKLWQTDERTRYFSEDLNTQQTDLQPETYVDHDNETLGWQLDMGGGIWQYDGRPFLKVSQDAEGRTYHLNFKVEPMPISDRQFAQKVTATQIKVDGKTGIIQWVLQVETIRTFTPLRDGVLRVDESNKIFDSQGSPSSLQKAYSIERLMIPFMAVNTYKGRDLRASFCNFLKDSGHPELIPPG